MNRTHTDEIAYSVVRESRLAPKFIEAKKLMHSLDRLSHPVVLVVLLVFVFHHAIKDRYIAVRQDLIDAEYVVEERVENYTTTSAEEPEHAEKSFADVRDASQAGFLGNLNDALEEVAIAGDQGQEDEWEDLDAQ